MNYILFLACLNFGQIPEGFDQARKASIEAYKNGDMQLFYQEAAKAHRLRPEHLGSRYNLAIAAVSTGHHEEAVKHLGQLAAMGLGFHIEKDPSLDPLKAREDFKAVLAQFEANRAPTEHGKKAFTLPRKDFFPEGIAWDRVSGDFFVGSIHHGEILRIKSDGRTASFAGTEENKAQFCIMGLAVDAHKRLLYACTTDLEQFKFHRKDGKQRTGILVFNIDTGEALPPLAMLDGTQKKNFNDIALAPDGTVYVSDGDGSGVYRFGDGKNLLPEGVFRSPQGLCFNEDGSLLYLADYSLGIYAIDPQSGSFEKVQGNETNTLVGIDGLAWHKGSLIAIQNGITPHRVVRWWLDPTGKTIVRQEVLEANHPNFDEPTLGVCAENRFFYVAASQWGRYDDNKVPLPLDQLTDGVIMSLSLD